MNRISGFQQAVALAAVAGGVVLACFGILTVADQCTSAHSQLERYKQEIDGWEACRTTKPTYYQANIGAVSLCRNGLAEAQQNVWVRIPAGRLVALYLFVGLSAAAIGGGITWICLWHGGLAVKRVGRFLRSGSRH